jgi:hypothetical protein
MYLMLNSHIKIKCSARKKEKSTESFLFTLNPDSKNERM